MKRRYLSLFLIALLFSALSIEAKPRGGGGFRGGSRSSSRSVSRPSTPRSSSQPKAAPAKPIQSKPQSAKPKMSDADRALQSKAASKPQGFRTRAEAEAAFKRDNVATYPTKFDSEPSVRPDYIPRTYNAGGTHGHVPIDYDRERREYGYRTQGTWNSYSPMNDYFMLHLLMNRHPQYVVVQETASGTPVAVSRGLVPLQQKDEKGIPLWGWVLICGGGIVIATGLMYVFRW